MTKIAYIVRTSTGGILTHVKTLINMTDKTTYKVIVIGDLDKDAINFFNSKGAKTFNVQLNNNIFKSIMQIKKIRKILLNENPQIVHIHSYIASIIGRAACMMSNKPNVIVTLHNYLPNNFLLNRLYILTEKLFSKITKKYIAISVGFKNYYVQQMHIPEDKITLIYNGIESDESKEISNNYNNISSNLIYNNKIQILTITRLIKAKGTQYFIMAASKILKKRNNIEFIIAGDGPERKNFEQLALSLNCRDYVKFLGYTNNISKYLNQASIFVLPSFTEGLPLSCIEAMRAKKPIIATRIAGNIEEVKDGFNGLLVEPGDADALSNAIENLLDDPVTLSNYGNNGYSIYKSLFNAEAMYKSTATVYKSVS